jgi:hypothetical protein
VNVRDRSGHAREEMVVARLHALAPHLDGEPDPAFRAATRARLVAMAAVRTPAPAPASGLGRLLAVRAPDVAPARWRSRLTAGLAGAALTVTALATLVAVADGARPGDVLYGVKRGTEQTQLAVAGNARGQTLLNLASTRLDELESLVGEEATALPAPAPAGPGDTTVFAADADPALVLETLRTMDAQTAEGIAWLTDRAVATEDAGPLDDLAGWTAEQSAGVAALQPLVPDAAADAVAGSLDLLAEIAARADGLQSALPCPVGPAVTGTDELGPVPGPCVADVPADPAPGGANTGPTPPGGTAGQPVPTPADPSVPPVSGNAGSGGEGAGSGNEDTGSGTGAGPGTPDLPVPAAPGLPTLPVPGGGGPDRQLPDIDPTLPNLPGSPGEPPTSPPDLPVTVCLPPLAIGDCDDS